MHLIERKKGNNQTPTIWILIFNVDNLLIFNLWNFKFFIKLEQPLQK